MKLLIKLVKIGEISVQIFGAAPSLHVYLTHGLHYAISSGYEKPLGEAASSLPQGIMLASFFIEHNRQTIELCKYIAVGCAFYQYRTFVKKPEGLFLFWKDRHHV